MTAQLVFNLALLALVGMLMVWYPDRLTLLPLLLHKVQPPTPADRPSSPRSRPRPRPGADRRAPGGRGPKGKKRPRKRKAK